MPAKKLRPKGKPRGRAFQKGAPSANKRGRPVGSRSVNSRIADELVTGKAADVIGRVLELALHPKSPDLRCLLWVADRILPPMREAPFTCELGPTETVSQMADAQRRILTELAAGRLVPSQAEALSDRVAALIDAHRDLVQERRLALLESMTR